MKQEKQEKLFLAVGEVGDDLISKAEYRRFAHPWRSTAAALALTIGLTALVLPILPRGCASSAPRNTETAVEAPAEAPAETPAEGKLEESVEDLPVKPEKPTRPRMMFNAIYYYQADLPIKTEKPEDLGHLLGQIQETDAESLLGANVYCITADEKNPYTREDGTPIYFNVYVETAEGYALFDADPNVIPTPDILPEVQKAVEAGDYRWLRTTFADLCTVSFEDASQLTNETAKQLFLDTLPSLYRWRPEDGTTATVPLEDVIWHLRRFLDPAAFDSTILLPDDEAQNAWVIAEDQWRPWEKPQTEVTEASLSEGNILTLHVSRGSEDPESVYTIRFDEDHWRYVSIVEESMSAVQPRDWLVFRSTYYYENPYVPVVPADDPPGGMGEVMGQVTASSEERLVGCDVHRPVYATEFTRFMVDGQSVTQYIYVDNGAGGVEYFTTHNEKTVSRYSPEDIKAAIGENNEQWVADTFVSYVEQFRPNAFSEGEAPDLPTLEAIFLGSLNMNTGTSLGYDWDNGDMTEMTVPLEEVQWRLDRFLDGGDYDLTQSSHYDKEWNALVWERGPLDQAERPALEVLSAGWNGENFYVEFRNPETEAHRKYTFRIDGDSWRYLSIEDL